MVNALDGGFQRILKMYFWKDAFNQHMRGSMVYCYRLRSMTYIESQLPSRPAVVCGRSTRHAVTVTIYGQLLLDTLNRIRQKRFSNFQTV